VQRVNSDPAKLSAIKFRPTVSRHTDPAGQHPADMPRGNPLNPAESDKKIDKVRTVARPIT
jgi:hypothetical protein